MSAGWALHEPLDWWARSCRDYDAGVGSRRLTCEGSKVPWYNIAGQTHGHKYDRERTCEGGSYLITPSLFVVLKFWKMNCTLIKQYLVKTCYLPRLPLTLALPDNAKVNVFWSANQGYPGRREAPYSAFLNIAGNVVFQSSPLMKKKVFPLNTTHPQKYFNQTHVIIISKRDIRVCW